MIAPDLAPLAVPTDSLELLPGNPRRGDVAAVRRSLEAFGQRKPIVARRDDRVVIAGNHTLQAARALGWAEIAVVWVDDDETTSKAFALADNRTAELGDYDEAALAELIGQVGSVDPELLVATGWDDASVKELLASLEPESLPVLGDPDDVPESVVGKTVLGDVWVLGPHRVMCGDSTSPTDMEKLMAGHIAVLLHADPPYGMGKEDEGVLNDDLRNSDLDEFQMSWWRICRKFVENKGSAYIWGNPADLWRLWYVGGLKDSEKLTMQNEIVWSKPSGFGQSSDLLISYPINTERCLFFQFGQQFGVNVNTDDFPEECESLRSYLAGEADKAGIKSSDIKKICGVQMYSHWFSKSQFTLIAEKHYERLANHYPGFFLRAWTELKTEWDATLAIMLEKKHRKLAALRSYFDNTHDNMNEVWEFGRVIGSERHEHATPKPVEMISRAIKSSAPVGGLVLEPFGGSGSTLIAAHQTNRVAYLMELDPKYVDVICARFQKATGIKPVNEATGREHDFLDG